MFKLFRRTKKRIEIPHNDPPPGVFQAVWEKKRQPSPGAQAYAWETLGLAPFSPIGPSVNVRKGISPLAGIEQPVSLQAVVLNGVPTNAGQIYGQALFDPSVGIYTTGIEGVQNKPFPFSDQPIGGAAI